MEPVKPFNSRVHIQERSWKAKEWGFRAVPARILAPAKEVENAYVVRLEDGSLRNAKVIIGGVQAPMPDDVDAPVDAEVADVPILPPRRLRHKSPSARVAVRKLTAASHIYIYIYIYIYAYIYIYIYIYMSPIPLGSI